MSVLFAAVSLACTVACPVLLPALSLPVLLLPCPGASLVHPFRPAGPGRFLPSVCYLYDICLGILIQMSLYLALFHCLPSLPPSLPVLLPPAFSVPLLSLSQSHCSSLVRPAACPALLFAPSCWPRFLPSVHVCYLYLMSGYYDTDVVII